MHTVVQHDLDQTNYHAVHATTFSGTNNGVYPSHDVIMQAVDEM